jgi:hypothetical protein
VKVLFPVKELLSVRRVEEAALIVMSCEPLKETLLILRELARMVAEPALPEMEPEMVLATVREVVEAVMAFKIVAKKFVEVALDEVELEAVKFWRVEEPFANRFVAVS